MDPGMEVSVLSASSIKRGRQMIVGLLPSTPFTQAEATGGGSGLEARRRGERQKTFWPTFAAASRQL